MDAKRDEKWSALIENLTGVLLFVVHTGKYVCKFNKQTHTHMYIEITSSHNEIL